MVDNNLSEGAPSGTGSRPSGRASKAVSPVPASIPSAVQCADKHEARLAEIAALERGWNGYRAEPISTYCIARARPLINLAEELGLQPWVAADTNRGVRLERAGEDDWSLELNPDGTFDFSARISCTWRAGPSAAETAELFLRFAAQHFRSSLAASAMSAGTAETEGLRAKPASAGPKGDAQNIAQPPSGDPQ